MIQIFFSTKVFEDKSNNGLSNFLGIVSKKIYPQNSNY